jgi:hypothetical protein
MVEFDLAADAWSGAGSGDLLLSVVAGSAG